MLDRSDGEYLAGLVRRTESVRNAIVRAVLTGNRYTVEYVATGGVVTAIAAQASVTYKVGQEVLVAVDLSGASCGKMPRIVGVAQSSENGVIVVERIRRTNRTSGTLTGYPSLPVQLTIAGLPVAFPLYGFGLVSAPTYGHASITNAVAAVVGGTSILCNVQALAGCPKGRYALTVAGVTLPDFFEVIA